MWTKEYDRAIKRVLECMAAVEREDSATVESVQREWAQELERRRATLQQDHAIVSKALADAWRSEALTVAAKQVHHLVYLATSVEQLKRQIDDVDHISKALIARRDVVHQQLDDARVELVRIIQATAKPQPRPARETDAYALPPAAIAELQSLSRQDHAADLAELDRAAA